MKAWHFVGPRLRDGRPVPRNGRTLKHKGPVRLCESGLHASVRLIDALKYAPGSTICRVELGGKIVKEYDKVVASERTILWRVDGEELLRVFARRCALDHIAKWNAPDVVKEWLKTGDPALQSAARSAARSAAGGAAESAAWSAAGGAAESAARSAARSAAWSAAGGAAESAAWSAARSAAESAQNRRLTHMVMEAHRAK